MPHSPSSTKFHATAWTFALLVALPVLYVLSVRPIGLVMWRAGVWDPYRGPHPPAWFDAYRYPYSWIDLNVPPVRKPMEIYGGWMEQLILPESLRNRERPRP